ncbi:MAG TPA: transporter [Holophagaceae bacterium]
MRCRSLLFSTLLLVAPGLWAQQAPPKEAPIQDNSFLLEEAYNQEPGVIQHISTFTRLQETGDWLYTFTEEWPVGGLTHQLSLTVPVQRLASSPDGGRRGFGDVALNYRYQLAGDGAARVAFAPRLSLLFPTGNHRQGRGSGHLGIQANLPLSITLGDRFVTHANLGYTYTPHAKDPLGHQADIATWNAGQSLIWLVRPAFNALLEFAYTRGDAVAGPGLRQTVRSAYLAPGIRWAWNFPSGLQIVPGVAAMAGVGPSRGEKGIFLYLSFEHPLK